MAFSPAPPADGLNSRSSALQIRVFLPKSYHQIGPGQQEVGLQIEASEYHLTFQTLHLTKELHPYHFYLHGLLLKPQPSANGKGLWLTHQPGFSSLEACNSNDNPP